LFFGSLKSLALTEKAVVREFFFLPLLSAEVNYHLTMIAVRDVFLCPAQRDSTVSHAKEK